MSAPAAASQISPAQSDSGVANSQRPALARPASTVFDETSEEAKRPKPFYHASLPYFCKKETLRETLQTHGLAIIPSILDNNEIDAMKQGAWSTLETIGAHTSTPIKQDNPESWRSFRELWPAHSMLLQHHGVGHAPFVWVLRQNPKIVDLFANLWRCKPEDLLCSFDGMSFHFPPESTRNNGFFRSSWYHTDQSPLRNGFECVQSWVTAFDVQPGDATLSVLIGSHQQHANLTKAPISLDLSKKTDKGKGDWCMMEPGHVQALQALGCTEHHISCPAGSMVFWDSRTIHCGREATRGRASPNFRCVVYICMMPRSSTADQRKLERLLEKRRKTFEARRMTSHWPNRCKLFGKQPHTYGAALPRVDPLPAPSLTPLGRSLVGY